MIILIPKETGKNAVDNGNRLILIYDITTVKYMCTYTRSRHKVWIILREVQHVSTA